MENDELFVDFRINSCAIKIIWWQVAVHAIFIIDCGIVSSLMKYDGFQLSCLCSRRCNSYIFSVNNPDISKYTVYTNKIYPSQIKR